jgi:hypothetical protein
MTRNLVIEGVDSCRVGFLTSRMLFKDGWRHNGSHAGC